MKQYVIIGGGVASVGCIEGIRSVDRDSKIVMITGEGCPTYCRPLISYYLQGKTDFEKMKYRPDEFYRENDCELIFAKALNIDKEAKTVLLDNGESVGYDALCVATGSYPFAPPFPGLDTVDNKFSFMTQADAAALEKAVTPESDVLIVGAGLIGLKCAEGLCGRVKSITVCDLAPRVLSSILDDTCAALMQKKLEEHGIRFMLGDSVSEFSGGTAHMKGGADVAFDALVLAVGVRAETSLVRDIGGECDRGIIIDTSMKTSLENIYAAGDCTQGYDSSIDGNRVLAILPNAYIQGHCAGVNMAGGISNFDNAIPMNAIGFFGYHALTAGDYSGEMYEESSGDNLKRLFIRDNRLVGFMMLGDIKGAGIYTSMIRNRTPLDTVDADLMKKSATYAILSPEMRRKYFGGVV